MPDGSSWIGSSPGIMAASWSVSGTGGPAFATGSETIAAELRDDRATVRAVLDGDRDAFRGLVEREGPSVVRACYRILGDIHEAEDIAQEAFVTAFRSLPTWRGDGPFGAWLSRIAVRLALRQAGRRRSVTWLDPTTSTDAPTNRSAVALIEAAIDARPAHDPQALWVRSEAATTVRQAVAALDEPYREVVSLRFFADLSLDEIARQTGRPLGTVKTHLRRGLQRLRAALDHGGAA